MISFDKENGRGNRFFDVLKVINKSLKQSFIRD